MADVLEALRILEEGIEGDERDLKMKESILKRDTRTCKRLRKEMEQRKINLKAFKVRHRL